jgi:hypothetical protein
MILIVFYSKKILVNNLRSQKISQIKKEKLFLSFITNKFFKQEN